ncbi:hypothetical protein L228DRAFT_260512 [Xylona heveae TC161]|uniref:Uncharacterized protein n=1 Tax=Xylona heveae (strain CBS 132557 / TC161) TaxID=1328760 RepID=A0A165HMP5_XYLHT|nr:hypothetical protein L228DRAFT_260512 [Xylona heveae TC161]KZF23743.1 hypothetical protein L228DRAFT_260512 [Xylona heveae TC161]
MGAEEAEIWVHVSAPSGTRDDALYRSQAKSYLEFETAESVSLGSLKFSYPGTATLQNGHKNVDPYASAKEGIESTEIQDHPTADYQVAQRPTPTAGTKTKDSQAQRSSEEQSFRDGQCPPLTSTQSAPTSAEEDGTFDGEGYSRILLEVEHHRQAQLQTAQATPQKDQTAPVEKDSTVYTTPSAFLDADNEVQTGARSSLLTDDQHPQRDSWDTPPSVVANSQPSPVPTYPFLTTTDSSPPWGSLPQSPLLKISNKRRKLFSPGMSSSQTRNASQSIQTSQADQFSVSSQAFRPSQGPILPSSQVPRVSYTQVYSSQPECTSSTSSGTRDEIRSFQSYPVSASSQGSVPYISQVSSSSAPRHPSPQDQIAPISSLPPDSPTQPITQRIHSHPDAFPLEAPATSSAPSLQQPRDDVGPRDLHNSTISLAPFSLPSSPPPIPSSQQSQQHTPHQLPPHSSHRQTPSYPSSPFILQSTPPNLEFTVTPFQTPTPDPTLTTDPHAFQLSQASFQSFQSSPGIIPPSTSSCEIHPPPPPTSITDKPPAAHITPSLALLVDKLDLPKRFKPVRVARSIRPNERGYWRICTSPWSQDVQDAFWAFLEDLVGTGRAGWGVWCWRGTVDVDADTDAGPGAASQHAASQASIAHHHHRQASQQNIVKIYCWGEIIPHIYLVAYLASQRRIVPRSAKLANLHNLSLSGSLGLSGLPEPLIDDTTSINAPPQQPPLPSPSPPVPVWIDAKGETIVQMY